MQIPVDAFIDMDGDVLTYTATLADGSALPSWLVLMQRPKRLAGHQVMTMRVF